MSLPIYIIGHKNPDSDSICSAMALAELKQKQGINAVAARLGIINPETTFILNKLNLESPEYLSTAKLKLSEIDIDAARIVSQDTIIRKSWDYSQEMNVKTVYVNDENDNYIGLATVWEMARIQMQDLHATASLLQHATIQNLADSVRGEVLFEGNRDRTGYVRIADKKMMDRDLTGAIMVLGDSEDAMFKCIAKGCAVIVIAENYVPDELIMSIAKDKGVTMITTPYNIMKIIQMIYRAIPIRAIMTSSKDVISFNRNEYLEDVEREMLKTRHSSYPVTNQGKLVGSVSRYHLLKSEKKKFILVDHNEKKQSISDIEQGEIVEIVDHHRIGDIETSTPISFRNMIVGSTCTIVALMYKEAEIKMSETAAKLLLYGMISDTLNFNSPTCTPVDTMVAKEICTEYNLDSASMANELFSQTATIKGKEFKDILYNDIKEYMLAGQHIAVSQVFTYDLADVNEIEHDFIQYMEEENKKYKYNFLLMVFTNIEGKGSKFLYVGDLSSKMATAIERFTQRGYVSRKKQIVPCIASELE
ncbi:putative manganese-dependent inorganic diphosphatase [Floccifex sp.]|uniref:putative manganese-dependent inorganic diphosphatase n=1 Tax=Floccifex sp. TaxID=2815810 RepID=UPI002A749F16|nr:putative manganese-dependent inorganic diphosphatase [Floccifex sp.]MDD7281681.1 putative manganese-dependent inorganic diphosphatase [Erysipelotrichaceae bacterium]MDY2958971.1 putative manganese-dependent inorganic diphosphatase [Floccifex sp.]